MKKSSFAAILATIIGACTGGAAIASWKLDRLPEDDAKDDDDDYDYEEKSEKKTDEVKAEDSAPDKTDESEEK